VPPSGADDVPLVATAARSRAAFKTGSVALLTVASNESIAEEPQINFAGATGVGPFSRLSDVILAS